MINYRENKGSHTRDTIERSHYHDYYNFGLQERIIKIVEMHVDMIDRDDER
jgi:hypothetical protein